MNELSDLFQRLSRGEGPFKLHAIPFIKAFGDIRVTAAHRRSQLKDMGNIFEGIRRIPSAIGDEFQWQQTSEGWEHVVELLDSLADSHEPAHQYLSDCPADEAIFVVSTGEYGDEVLEGLA